MTRIVGHLDRSPYIVDPVEALRAGRRVDAQLASARIPQPRGVFRAPHAVFNELDRGRGQQAAQRVAGGTPDA